MQSFSNKKKMFYRAILRPIAFVLFAGTAANSIHADEPRQFTRERMVCHDWCSHAVRVCYDFGCKNRELVGIPHKSWKSVTAWFRAEPPDPAAEREQIRQAVGLMEAHIGRLTPTHRDQGQNGSANAKFPGQLDCIDESINTTTYMKLFEEHGLLRWHRVVERAHRKAIFDQHYSGQVEELITGKRYVVDSWFHPNGYLPDVQDTATWVKIPLWTSYVNNSE